MLGEQLLVEERRLDGVGDLLDLLVEAADVGVADVGDLFEDAGSLDLGAGQLLQQQAGACVHQHRVAGADQLAHEHLGQVDPRSSSARPRMMARRPSSRISLTVTTSPLVSRAAGHDHVQQLVQDDLAAPGQLVGVEGGVDGDILRPPE